MLNAPIHTQNVAVLALNDTVATTVIGPQDVFSMAGVLYERSQYKEPVCYFNVQVVTPNGKPVRCYNNLLMTPHCSMEECNPDIVVIPGILNIDETLSANGAAIEWLKSLYDRNCVLMAICSGSLLLAATGLLDNKIATTHWAMANEFRKRFPNVLLRPDEMITDDSGLVCSGGYDSFLDASIYMVEKFYGATVALQCSKVFLHNLGRRSQAPYAIFSAPRDHGDEEILQIQQEIENKFANNFDFDELAKEYGMSRRTLERRFKKATGVTLLVYQQRTRVEHAKALLESGNSSFDEISFKVGYMDNSFFRKLFIKYTTLRPREYRSLFS